MLGMEPEHTRSLLPLSPDLGARVEVTRSGGSCLVGTIAEPLRRLGAHEGDVGFFCFQEARYAIVLRTWDELDGADEIGQLLWRCGLDPADPGIRGNVWGRLARTLGGSKSTRDEVRRRLEERRDPDLLALLDDVGIVASRGAQTWPAGWQYVLPDAEQGDALAVLGARDRIRRVVGVVDVSGQPGEELIVTDGGLAWIEAERDESAADVLMVRGLIPAARKRSWTRWLRAEHALRLTGLGGQEFWASREGSRWRSGGVSAESLLEALERVPRPAGAASQGPAESVKRPYPRAALPFDRVARDAENRDVLAIGADERSGIRAVYGDGREVSGSSLLDVLSPG
jgi:hypothetical protein